LQQLSRAEFITRHLRNSSTRKIGDEITDAESAAGMFSFATSGLVSSLLLSVAKKAPTPFAGGFSFPESKFRSKNPRSLKPILLFSMYLTWCQCYYFLFVREDKRARVFENATGQIRLG
jgi:hypothetical protein